MSQIYAMFAKRYNKGTVNTIWDGNDNEIFLHDDSSITQLTDNTKYKPNPHINTKDYIVCSGYDGLDIEIFMGVASEPISSTFFIVGGATLIFRGVRKKFMK